MRTFLLAGGLMSVSAGLLFAQGWRRDADWRYNDRRGDPRDVSYRSNGSVRQIIRDLENIAGRSYVDRHEAGHFRRAIESLYEFDSRLSRGKFDRGRLDRAIGNIADLAQAHQIHPRFRNVLRSHLYQLQRMRSGGGDYGANGGRGRYGW